MSIFPGSTPSFTGFTSSHTLAQDQHAAQHNSEQAEIIALANKIGIGASTPASNLVLRGTDVGTSSWAQVNLTSDVTGVLPQANGGTGTTLATGTGAAAYQTSPSFNSPSFVNATGSLNTPVIADFTNATHTHASNSQGGQLNGANAITDGTITPAELIAGTGSSWVWQSWSPTWANLTVGNGTVEALYIQVGKTVICNIRFTMGATSSMGTEPTFTLPVTAAARFTTATRYGTGGLYIEDANTQGYVGNITSDSTTVARPRCFNASGTYLTDAAFQSTVPFTWGTGDWFAGLFIYEAT